MYLYIGYKTCPPTFRANTWSAGQILKFIYPLIIAFEYIAPIMAMIDFPHDFIARAGLLREAIILLFFEQVTLTELPYCNFG